MSEKESFVDWYEFGVFVCFYSGVLVEECVKESVNRAQKSVKINIERIS